MPSINDYLLFIYLHVYALDNIPDFIKYDQYFYFSNENTEIIAIFDPTLDIYDIKRIARKMTKKYRKVYSFSVLHGDNQILYLQYPKKIRALYSGKDDSLCNHAKKQMTP